MPRPTGFVAADVGNVQTVIIRLGEIERLNGNPTDFVFTLFGNFEKLFRRRGSPLDTRLRRRINFLCRVDFNELACVLRSIGRVVFAFVVKDSRARENVSADWTLKIAVGSRLYGDDFLADRTLAPETFLFVGVKRPVMRLVGQAVPQIILNVVNDDCDFVWVVGIGTHGTHRLLHVKSQRISRPRKDNGLTIRHVETFTKQFSVAQNFDTTCAKVLDNLCAKIFRCLAVAMSGGNARVIESVGNGFRMTDVDAVADSLLTVGVFQIVVDDAADNFLVAHDVFKV